MNPTRRLSLAIAAAAALAALPPMAQRPAPGVARPGAGPRPHAGGCGAHGPNGSRSAP